jgi:DNA topoisomerase VI subunit B
MTRTTFQTPRVAEFASIKEMVTQTGHDPDEWLEVIVKELVDNGIDAAEVIGAPPVIEIWILADGIAVIDNGGGIAPEDVERMTDFTQRVSSNEAYVSPTRGKQGNALQTILAMPYLKDEQREPGKVIIDSRGIQHAIAFEVDTVDQVPKATDLREPGKVQNGTAVYVHWPVSACSELLTVVDRIVQIADGFVHLNPHLTISVTGNGVEEFKWEARKPVWSKWLPSNPISAHWYDIERFNRLIVAQVADDRRTGRETLVAEFIATFRGMTRSDAKKAVLDRIGAARTTLAALYNEGKGRVTGVAALLQALKDETKPVKPSDLGVIGKEHLADQCESDHGDMDSFDYKKLEGVTDGLPWVIEVAFAHRPDFDLMLVTGCNWSPGIRNPFRLLYAVLQEQRISGDEPAIVIVHLTCPYLAFGDRGKASLQLPTKINDAICDAVEKATARWAKQRKAEERHASARANRIERLARSKKMPANAAVYAALPAAYAKVSDNGELPANVRQIYYALRNEVQEQTGKPLGYGYFSQTILSAYVREHDVADWDIVYDDRGHLTEPHTGHSIGLGTLAVREYLDERSKPEVINATIQNAHIETHGPAGNYGALVYIEKEGFDSLIESQQLHEIFDCAFMSCKGMSVTAARALVEAICRAHGGIPLYVLHDFDKAGMSIASTLTRDTKRYQFTNEINVTDIGLRLEDIDELNLRPFAEPAAASEGDEETRAANMRLNGATEEEIEFLLEQSVELNALTSRQFIDLIVNKLTGAGVKKLVPDKKLLDDTFRAVVHGERVREQVEKILAAEQAKDVTVPDDIEDQVRAMLAKEPIPRWDAAVAEVAKSGLRKRGK